MFVVRTFKKKVNFVKPKKIEKSTLTISILENIIQLLYTWYRPILFNKSLYYLPKLVILIILVLEYDSITILGFR